jgi:signal transduction histidine kinase
MTPDSMGEPQDTVGNVIRPRAAFWRALGIWVLTLAAFATSMIYNHVHPLPVKLGDSTGNALTGTVAVAFVVGFASVGALLAWKRPANPIGWLLSATGLSFAAAGAGLLLLQFPRTRAWGSWTSWIFFLGVGFVVFVLLLFPTGSLPSRRWRPVAWAAAAALVAWTAGNAFAPTLLTSGPPRVRNPMGVAAPAGHIFSFLAGAGGLLIVATGLAAIVSLVFRYRRAGAVEREQLKWLVYAGGLIVAAELAEIVIERIFGLTGETATTLENVTGQAVVVLVPIAIGIAIFRYHLYDIDVVINKTLVYGSLAVFITGVYVAIVVGLGSLAQHGARPSLALSIAATAVVAIAFQPVRAWVQRLANRLVYGRRATPYEVLADFAGRMAGAYAAEDLLPRMARILAEGTAAARADVWLKSADTFHDGAAWPAEAPLLPPARATAADVPAYPGADRILPVRYRGEVLGALSVSKRPGEALTPTEDRLLADLASQVGLVLKNAGLREELLARLEEIRASRLRLVAAQDEERRRIERNIHDGAQQQLVALAIKLSITESMIGTDTEGERELLAELREDAAGAVEELRDLARGIYPPLLAGEGLVTALRAQARKAAVPTSVTAEGVGRYQQDLEAAVYFCVLEALQNVAKYAGATRAEVRLAASGNHLRFEVTDDGAGFDPESRGYGTGLQGMADRLHAHGGSLDVRSAPGAGTTIAGRLPCRVLEAA